VRFHGGDYGILWRMETSRRAFLKAAAVAPALGSTPPAAAAAIRESSFDPWVEIDAASLRHNASEVHRRNGGRPILAVIKNNGYGHGVANLAQVLEPLPFIAGFAVVKLHEAVVLRDAGIRKPVLLMGPFDTRELADIVGQQIMPMVYTPIGDAIDAAATHAGHAIALHVCVDTGIGRVGVPFRSAAALVRDLAQRKSVAMAGTMMTFTEDEAFDKEQLRRFTSIAAELKNTGVDLGRLHAASSFALFQHPDSFFDMVRPGMALMGVYSEQAFRSTGVMDLRPAASLKARVAYVKKLEAGDSAGYERAYRAERPVWLATLPVGHVDGLPRSAAKGARVKIGGSLYPIVASLSASHSIVEIGDKPRVQIGDIATFFDGQDGSRPEDFCASCNASVYDLLMHLHADLPRRVV
jgi:alanine racemase